MVKELKELESGAILEDSENIKERILNGSKDSDRKLSKWNARQLQSMLKLKRLGLPVKYVNPANSSKTCPSAPAAQRPMGQVDETREA